MSSLSRFSASMDGDLLARFDALVAEQGYPTRSKAIADLIRERLVEREWAEGREVAAAIVMVYDHHKRELSHRLTHVQHDHHKMIIASQHVHLDHDNCLEVVVARGQPDAIQSLANALRSTKGVKYCSLAAASTGNL